MSDPRRELARRRLDDRRRRFGTIPAGTCPSCTGRSHLGFTCRGLTTAEVVAILWPAR